ncbi:MAG: hypothetical protein ACRENV_03180 [Candidatus Dormibacteria bacterium]
MPQAPVPRAVAGPAPGALDLALVALQRRYGPEVVRAASRGGEVSGLPTGAAELDGITGCAGLPRGRISHLSGGPASGAFDLGLALGAAASRTGLLALVDFTLRIDPGDLGAYGGDLGNCWVVRPRRSQEGWAAARALARAGVDLCLLVLDQRALDTTPGSTAALLAALVEGGGAGVVLGGAASPAALRSRISLELECQRLGWALAHGDVCGMRLRVRVARSHLGAPEASCRLQIGFPRPYPPAPSLSAEPVVDEEPSPLRLAVGSG